MGELLDERVVEMRFDNANFEHNVGQSIKTINKLKESLDFEDAGSSFDNLAASAANETHTKAKITVRVVFVLSMAIGSECFARCGMGICVLR